MDTLQFKTYRSGGSRNNRLFTEMAVEGRQEDAQRFLNAMADAVRLGIEAGADKATLKDIAGMAHDAASDLLAGMRRDLDNENLLPELASLNFDALDAVLKEVA